MTFRPSAKVRPWLVAFTLVSLMAAAACGDNGTSTASPDPSATTTREPTAGPSGTETVRPSATGSAQPSGTETAGPSATASAQPCATVDPDAGLTVYSGRSQELIEPLIERFERETGIDVSIRYGGTAELAATILEEGDNSPADLFFAQDAGALGALVDQGRFAKLPDDLLSRVDPRYRSDNGLWVGVSGRARTVIYNTAKLRPEDLPPSILDFTDPKWSGKIGWAPTNGSFQAFVTALRLLRGDDAARSWLEGIASNDVRTYDNNVAIVQAVANGEVEVGFVNHYYLFQFLAQEGDSFPARNYYTAAGDPGSLVNVAGVGILDSAEHPDAAIQLARFLLSAEAQRFFAQETYEYPLLAGIAGPAGVPSLDSLDPPDIDLSSLDDLEGTLQMLQETGVLP